MRRRKRWPDADEPAKHRILVDVRDQPVAECALGLTINLGNYESLKSTLSEFLLQGRAFQAHQEAFESAGGVNAPEAGGQRNAVEGKVRMGEEARTDRKQVWLSSVC